MPKKKKSYKRLDIDKVEMLASFGCTHFEIAKFFQCDESTIRNSYKEVMETGREKMKLRLRQLQWKHAELGNTSLLIFLGKNYLNQTDKAQVDHIGNLEAVLKECGYEDSRIGKKDTEQGEVLEPNQIQADPKSISHTPVEKPLPN
mgnify:CR=1 FL=1